MSPTGRIFVAGRTGGDDFPLIDAIDTTFESTYEGILAEFDIDGTPKFLTYVGGDRSDILFSVAVDQDDVAYVLGHGGSTDLATTDGALTEEKAGTFDDDAFVARIEGALAPGWIETYVQRDLSAATVGQPYEWPVLRTTAPGTVTLTEVSGNLGAGIALDEDGVAAGTPTHVGEYRLIVALSGDSGSAYAQIRLAVAPRPSLIGSGLPQWTADVPLATAIPFVGGAPPFTFTLESGSVPAGMTLSVRCYDRWLAHADTWPMPTHGSSS